MCDSLKLCLVKNGLSLVSGSKVSDVKQNYYLCEERREQKSRKAYKKNPEMKHIAFTVLKKKQKNTCTSERRKCMKEKEKFPCCFSWFRGTSSTSNKSSCLRGVDIQILMTSSFLRNINISLCLIPTRKLKQIKRDSAIVAQCPLCVYRITP